MSRERRILPAPEGYPATFGLPSISIEQQLSGLLDVLHGIRADMTSGVMPRAARLTGTAQNLSLMVQQLDAAIGIGRGVVLTLEARGARSRSNVRSNRRRYEGGRSGVGHEA